MRSILSLLLLAHTCVSFDEDAILFATLTRDELQHLDAEGFSAVHRAAGHGAAEAVIAALEKGVDINHRATNGMTALAFAANKGHENIAHVLIERGARLEPGYPLILAASNGHAAVVRLLLEHGADADATADALGGTTALHAAATMGQADAVDALLEGGADPFFEIELLGTPLQAATSYAHQYSRDENDALRREVKATNGGNFKGVLRSLRKAVAAKSKGKSSSRSREEL